MKAIGLRLFQRLPQTLQQAARDWRGALERRRANVRARRLREAKVAIGAKGDGLPDVNHLLHHLRGAALRALPKHGGHFVSVGCSGTWYFNWIAQMVGTLEQHTGVEFYTPRPDDLPPGVRWIANTAGHMPEIADGVADVLFSGQNIEHLWQEDVVGFLLESHRVLKEGGLLVIDSPNRRIAARLGWSQPEHTVELNPEEMEGLLVLAGFVVERVIGLWLCEDSLTGALLPFDELTAEGPWPLQRRVDAAYHNPHSSFIWWIEARKQKQGAQIVRLRERIADIFRHGWPERLNRLKTVIGTEISHNNRPWFASEGRQGMLLFGPYAPLRARGYVLRLRLMLMPPLLLPPKSLVGYAEVVFGDDHKLLATQEIRLGETPGGEFEVALAFTLSDTCFGVQFRVFAYDTARLAVQKSVTLTTVCAQVQAAA